MTAGQLPSRELPNSTSSNVGTTESVPMDTLETAHVSNELYANTRKYIREYVEPLDS
jgi:hypothetical protein